jgi:hypothetical protein
MAVNILLSRLQKRSKTTRKRRYKKGNEKTKSNTLPIPISISFAQANAANAPSKIESTKETARPYSCFENVGPAPRPLATNLPKLRLRVCLRSRLKSSILLTVEKPLPRRVIFLPTPSCISPEFTLIGSTPAVARCWRGRP